MITAAILFLLLTDLQGEVVAVKDGDTVVVLVDKTLVTIRLASIDAPEKKQPFGQQSKAALSSLVFGKTIRVVTSGKDRYGRTIGTLYDGETNVNDEMIATGMAWHYTRFSSDVDLSMLECSARTNSLGLWSGLHCVPPWEYRLRRIRENGVSISKVSFIVQSPAVSASITTQSRTVESGQSPSCTSSSTSR